MIEPRIILRPVEPSDCEDLLLWRNDQSTRENAFNTQHITIDEHQKWFNNSLKNKNRTIYIALNSQQEKIGQIRFDKTDNEAEVSIIIAQNNRSQGYGTEVISLGSIKYLKESNVKKIIARIKPDNHASINAFKKAGFKEIASNSEYITLECYKL